MELVLSLNVQFLAEHSVNGKLQDFLFDLKDGTHTDISEFTVIACGKNKEPVTAALSLHYDYYEKQGLILLSPNDDPLGGSLRITVKQDNPATDYLDNSEYNRLSEQLHQLSCQANDAFILKAAESGLQVGLNASPVTPPAVPDSNTAFTSKPGTLSDKNEDDSFWNVNGSSDDNIEGYDSKIAYWIKATGWTQKPGYVPLCCVKGCPRGGQFGGHVVFDATQATNLIANKEYYDGQDNLVYILPLCPGHNNKAPAMQQIIGRSIAAAGLKNYHSK